MINIKTRFNKIFMSKLYLGENEIYTGGGSSSGGSYDDTALKTRVTALEQKTETEVKYTVGTATAFTSYTATEDGYLVVYIYNVGIPSDIDLSNKPEGVTAGRVYNYLVNIKLNDEEYSTISDNATTENDADYRYCSIAVKSGDVVTFEEDGCSLVYYIFYKIVYPTFVTSPVYCTKDEYDALVEAGTVDEDTFYVITDLAEQDELSELATHADIESAIEDLNDTLRDTADTYYTELSANLTTLKNDITSAKNTAVSAVQSQQSTSVSAVSSQQTTSVNAVKSQQTTSVNAVTSAQTTATTAITTAKETAISDINTAKQFTPAIAVMTESEYLALTSIDSNVLYVLTTDESLTAINETLSSI